MMSQHAHSLSIRRMLAPVQGERGIALITALMLLILMSLLGFAALSVTSIENQIAGLSRTADSASSAAESCLSTGVQVIQHTLEDGMIPASALENALPTGPIPQAHQSDLQKEILGQLEQDPDSVTGTGSAGPDLQQTVGSFTVSGDIDRLYAKGLAGGTAQFGSGADPAAQTDIYYRITCRATLSTTGTAAQLSALYACTLAGGDSCRKAIL